MTYFAHICRLIGIGLLVLTSVTSSRALPNVGIASVLESRQAISDSDPCVDISGKTYVLPSQLAACLSSFPFNTTLRDNIVDVVSKTLNFHTSVNYQLSAPPPFAEDVHVDIIAELERIGQSEYENDFALHKDISYQVGRLMDGHCVYINYCYDSFFVTYLPFPLVNLNSGPDLSEQDIYIAPEAFDVIKSQFSSFLDEWQTMAGFNFTKYSGAKVLAIDGVDPWTAVEQNADIVGTWQGHGTRENSFFSSYLSDVTGWSYRMGDFALRSLPPDKDYVNMTVIPRGLTNSTESNSSGTNSSTANNGDPAYLGEPETISVPYISQNIGISFTNGSNLWNTYCRANSLTNGVDYFGSSQTANADAVPSFIPNPFDPFEASGASKPPALVDPSPPRFAPSIPIQDRHRPISTFIDLTAFADVGLPSSLSPTPIVSNGTAQFYLQGEVGILALGSFSTGADYATWFQILKDGLNNLKSAGATKLIVDVTNNAGGYICVANFLHRFLAGASNTTLPNAGFDTKARYNELASNITQVIADNGVPLRGFLIYDPLEYEYGNSSAHFPPDYNWLEPPVKTVVNGREDAFSQRIGDECYPFPIDIPDEMFLPMESIGIVNNGRCASSCAIFTITMAKKEGVRTAVVGGRSNTTQQYTGTVGGQSTSFQVIDSEIKTTHLKKSSLAPPDFLTFSYQGLTWRLGFGVGGVDGDDQDQPEEWQNHEADDNIPLTFETVNNPAAIWKTLAAHWWPELH